MASYFTLEPGDGETGFMSETFEPRAFKTPLVQEMIDAVAAATGGTKHDKAKPRMELLSTTAMVEIAKVLTFGANKYEDHNWRKGFAWSRLYGAALRHLTAHMDGEDNDPESGLSHLAHLGCCVMFLLEHEAKGLGDDDRYKTEA